ncbi:MAG: DNA methyltransferase [Candidatus Shapirobacteria bacterium]|jgi:site-specific DNA-methyltransferase (adenine-specific)
MNKVHLIDNMEFMKTIPDKYYELAIVDPPYRDQNQPTIEMRQARKAHKSNRFVKTEILGNKPSQEYFNELFRISKKQIVWGANNFKELPEYKGFVIWVKKEISETFSMSMAEIAFLSENIATTSKVYYGSCHRGGNSIHPTQKPLALYKWQLQRYAKPGYKIFDSHVGSGSIRIACYDLGYDFEGCEIDKDYWQAQEDRFKKYLSQPKLFDTNKIEYNQDNLF